MPKSRYREIAEIGIPAVLESLVAVIITSIDTKMISGLGSQALSAVSFTSQPKQIFFSVFFALGTTVSIYTAQATGREDAKEGNVYFHSILRMTVLLSLILGIGAAVFAQPIMMLCNRQADTLALSVRFFRVIMGFSVFHAISIVLNAALRGIGNTKVTLIAAIANGAVDIVVNYLLIEGHCGFPRLEIVGDAIGTVAGTVAACGVSLFFILRHSDFLTLKGVLSVKKDPAVAKNIRGKAGNTVSENILTRLGFLISSIIVSGLSSDVTAVYAVTMILLNYSFAFGDGLQTAASSLIGRSNGAGHYGEIKKYLRSCLLTGAIVSAVLSVIYILGSSWFFGLYFSDANSIGQGIKYSYIAALLTFLQILRIIMVGSMRGMGEVKIPRKMATLCVLIINPGVSFLLTQVVHFGIWGIWIGSVVSQAVWFVMSCIYTRRVNAVENGAAR